jgi:NAD(P)-dependent dehydrogenase (short-subunit alcohol dehydrogenase family)
MSPDRVALISGATGNLGRVVSADLAAAGFRLGLAGRDVDQLTAQAAELELADGRWTPALGNLLNEGEAAEAVAAVHGRWGRLDAVIHLIGGWVGGASVTDADPDDFSAMLDQHLWTTLNVTRAAFPLMTAAGWGRVVAVSSPVAGMPTARNAPYVVGKAAQEALLGTLAREAEGTGVTVNVVHVRAIRSPGDDTARGTDPAAISAAICWLVSEDADAVNGAHLPLFSA